MTPWMGVVSLWAAVAVATEPQAPLAPFDATADALSAELRSPAPDAKRLLSLLDLLGERAEELDAPIDPDAWVRVLLDVTIVRYQLDLPWRAPRIAAYRLRPELPVPVGPSLRELREWVPGPSASEDELPSERRAWLDGRELGALPPLDGLHLIQGVRCDRWHSHLVEGPDAAQERQRWLDPCAPGGWRGGDVVLVAGGGGLALTGAIAAAVSFGVARSLGGGDPTQTASSLNPAQRGRLRAANTAGWVGIGAGFGLVIPGVVGRIKQVRRDRARP